VPSVAIERDADDAGRCGSSDRIDRFGERYVDMHDWRLAQFAVHDVPNNADKRLSRRGNAHLSRLPIGSCPGYARNSAA